MEERRVERCQLLSALHGRELYDAQGLQVLDTSGRCPPATASLCVMDVCAPLATVAVSFFDPHHCLSALALQHVRADGRTALVYHDAPGVAAAAPLLAGVAETLMAGLGAGHTLSLIETSMPEHEAEPFVYARVTLSFAAWLGRVNAGSGRVIAVDEVARACGITVREVRRTEVLVLSVRRARSCAFPGFRQLPLGERGPSVLAVA
jgi:hypothetical protein